MVGRRLTGLDAGFFSFESPTTHLTVVGALVFDAGELPGGLSFRRIRNLMAERIDLVPPFRMKMLEVPFGADHPSLVDDPSFDLDYHVRRASVPSPGGRDELAGFVADVASRPLDRRRPLWEFHVVEGLELGRVALVTKVHHAIIDGVSGAELVAALFDLSPDPSPQPLFGGGRSRRASSPPETPSSEDAPPGDDARRPATPLPGELVRLGRALLSLPGQLDAVKRSVSGTAHAVRSMGSLRHEGSGGMPPLPFRAVRTSINRAISPHRRVAVADLPLSEVRRVGEVLGGTTNDILLACASGSLRAFFAEREEAIEAPLVAMVPVSVRTPTEQGALGNRVAATLVSLATEVESPVGRLEKIRAGMEAAKEQCASIGPDVFTAWSEATLPAFATRLSRLVTNLRIFDHVTPPFNVIVSNVPGPDFPVYLAGARLAAIYPFGPVIEGVGVNITVFSYLETVHVGVQACWDLVPDVRRIAEGMNEALDELVTEVIRHGRPVPWWHSELPA